MQRIAAHGIAEIPVGTRRPDNTKSTPIIIVIGMHRSGTSLCSNVLSLLGLDMADEVSRHETNTSGHWERWEIVGFHDRILQFLDRDYFSPMHDFPLPNGWWAEPEVRAIRCEIEDFLRTRMRLRQPFGFKDPRICRLLPIWTQIFRSLNLDPRFVFCVRSPSQVARSLHTRDGLDPKCGEYRWALYNAEAWRHLCGEVCTIAYDDWFSDQETTFNRLADFLSDFVTIDRRSVASAVNTLVARNPRHETTLSSSARQPAIRYLYDLLRQADPDANTQTRIGHFVDQFLGFQQTLPFERLFNTVEGKRATEADEANAREQALHAREAELVHHAAGLRAALDAEVAAANNVRQERDAAFMQIETAKAREAEFVHHATGLQAALDVEIAAAETVRQERDAANAQHNATSTLWNADRITLTAVHDRIAQELTTERDIALGTAIAARRQEHHWRNGYVTLLNWSVAYHDSTAASLSWRLTSPLRKLGIGRPIRPPRPDILEN